MAVGSNLLVKVFAFRFSQSLFEFVSGLFVRGDVFEGRVSVSLLVEFVLPSDSASDLRAAPCVLTRFGRSLVLLDYLLGCVLDVLEVLCCCGSWGGLVDCFCDCCLDLAGYLGFVCFVSSDRQGFLVFVLLPGCWLVHDGVGGEVVCEWG